jgi:hypothetical protein
MAPEMSLGRLIFSFHRLILGGSAFLRTEVEASIIVGQFTLNISLDIALSLLLVGVLPNRQQQLLLIEQSETFVDFEVRQELKTPRGKAEAKYVDKVARLLVPLIGRSEVELDQVVRELPTCMP